MSKLLLETGTVASTLVPFRKGCISSNQSHVSLFQRHSSTKHLVRQFSVIRTYPSPSQTHRGPITHFAPGPPAAFSHIPKTTGDSNCYYHATLTGVQKIPGEQKSNSIAYVSKCMREGGWNSIFRSVASNICNRKIPLLEVATLYCHQI